MSDSPADTSPLDLQPSCCPQPLRHAALCRALDETHAGETRSAAARILAQAIAGEVSLDGLLVLVHQQQLVGSCWASVYPGRIAQLTPAWLAPGYPSELADRLLAAGVDYVRGANARLAQVSLPLDSARQQQALSRAGFESLATLAYLASERQQFPTRAPTSPLEFVGDPSPQFERLASVLEETYRNTLDCPGLSGARTAEDVLEGYRQLCQGEVDQWWLVRHEGADVGCLILSSDVLSRQAELVYLGLIPAARGRGWGHALVRQAQWQARQGGILTLSVAVDCANGPGVRIYERAGFSVWDRQLAWVKQL